MTELLVMLKPPALSNLFVGQAKYMRFRSSPDVTIAIGARVKRPGDQLIGDAKDSKVVNQPQVDEMGAYERLLSDAMVSDGTVFAGQEFVEVKGQI